MPKGSASSNAGDYRPISIMPVLSKVFEKIVTGKLSNFFKSNSIHPPSQFSYPRGLGTCDALLTLSHRLQVLWTGAWREDLFSWTSQMHSIRLGTAVCCIS